MDQESIVTQDKPKKKRKLIPSLLFGLCIIFVAGGAMYWLQWPFSREQIKETTGLDLNSIDTLAQSIGEQASVLTSKATEQTTALISQTPLGNLINQQNSTSQSVDGLLPLNSTAVNTLNNSTDELFSQNSSMAMSDTQLPSVDINSTFPQNITSMMSDPSSIIQPPADAPVLNLVTEMTEATKAQLEEEEERRIKAVEDALMNLTLSSLTPEELAIMPEVKSPLSGLIPPDAGSGQDVIITNQFISDMARYMVENYKPSPEGRGQINISPISTNIYYGTTLKGLTNTSFGQGSRSKILSYVYTPSMLEALYSEAESLFITDLANYASKPMNTRAALTPAQQKQMFVDYANYFSELSKAFHAIAAFPQLSQKSQQIDQAEKNLQSSQKMFSSLQIAFEEARYNNSSTDLIKEEMLKASQNSEQGKNAFKELQNLTLTQLRSLESIQLNDATLFYLFQWVARRGAENQNPESIKAATNKVGDLFSDLSQTLRTAE